MSVSLDTSFFDLPAGAVISAVATRDAPDTRSRLVAQLRGRVEESRREQKEWSRRFDRLYHEARTRDWNEQFLVQWAASLLEKQRAALELFHPMIEGLQDRTVDYAARPDAELLELCRASIHLVLGWITPYQTLSGKLLELAKQRTGTGQILHASPVDGEIDHGELTREIISRFPNILSELAK